jgi:hypothetical protein
MAVRDSQAVVHSQQEVDTVEADTQEVDTQEVDTQEVDKSLVAALVVLLGQ